MRFIALLTFCMWHGLAVATGSGAAPIVGKLACESAAVTEISRNITCAVDGSGTPQRFRFKAHFAGSHDDTRLTMTATLDGRPLQCGPGSTPSAEAEDGEVSLECKFSITGKVGTKPVLGFKLSIFHARYVDSELASSAD